ncbi:MAG: hypothetical protein JNG86_05640 [Verrucomicrobiaceae bacterium]|nr:hypothetical protein [Verrucomicrobiaceae bacterium]
MFWAIFALQLIMGLAIAALAFNLHVKTMAMDADESAMPEKQEVILNSIRQDTDPERLRRKALLGYEVAASHWQAIRSITHDLRDGTLGLVVAAFATAGVAWYGLRARKTGSDA